MMWFLLFEDTHYQKVADATSLCLPDDGSDVVKVPLFVPEGGLQVTLFLELTWRPLVLNLTGCIEVNGRIEQIYASDVVVLAPVEVLAYGPPDQMIRCDAS